LSNTRTTTEKVGLRITRQIVEEQWKCRFQEISSTNDDGIDAIIFISKHGEVTGEMVFVQIKTGKSYCHLTEKRPDVLNINLTATHIAKHRPRWNKYPGPVVLVYVDNTTDKLNPKAWWCDLKSDDSYSDKAKSYVLIKKTNRFREHSKGHFKALCTHSIEQQYQPIETKREDFIYIANRSISSSLKLNARKHYLDLSKRSLAERSNPLIGEITISRVGWRHICRPKRKPERIIQSFQLLGAILPIIQGVNSYEILGHRKSFNQQQDTIIEDYIGLKAKVSFPHRYQSIVMMVLRRKRVINNKGVPLFSQTWFYSIYETKRGEIAF
jgi:hypothetical protein